MTNAGATTNEPANGALGSTAHKTGFRVYSSNSQRTRTARNTMKKRLLSVLLLLALALSLLPTTALAGNDLTGFTAAASISSDALPAMQWAVAQAIIRGDSFRLNPQSGATRASACAMLHRFFVT